MTDTSILKIIADNPALTEALKKVLLDEFSLEEGFNFRSDITDELIGQVTRATLSGRQKIDRAFGEIKKYKTRSEPVEKQNPAR
jgi:hypothetical protein